MSKPYWWFQGASVVELVARLQAAGPETARLEVHKDGKSLTFHVVRTDGVSALDDPPPINDSKICPPICS